MNIATSLSPCWWSPPVILASDLMKRVLKNSQPGQLSTSSARVRIVYVFGEGVSHESFDCAAHSDVSLVDSTKLIRATWVVTEQMAQCSCHFGDICVWFASKINGSRHSVAHFASPQRRDATCGCVYL